MKKIYECKIGTDDSKSSGKISGVTYVGLKWHVKEIVHILQTINRQYGENIFSDKKRFAAVLADKVFEYPEEGKILKMVFNEGIYATVKSSLKMDDQFVRARIIKFLDNLGLDAEIKKNITEILIAAFVTKNKENIAIFNISAASEVGQIYFVAKENVIHPEMRMFRMIAESEAGIGLLNRDAFRNYVEALNATSDAYKFLSAKCLIFKVREKLAAKNHNLFCECCDKDVLTSSLTLATILSLASSVLDKKPLNGLVVLGNLDAEGNLQKCTDLESCMRICDWYQARTILLPAENAADLAKIPTELLKFSMFFYHTPDEAIKYALDIKE